MTIKLLKLLVHFSSYGDMLTVAVTVRQRHMMDPVPDAVFQATLMAERDFTGVLGPGWSCEIWHREPTLAGMHPLPTIDEMWERINAKGGVEYLPEPMPQI